MQAGHECAAMNDLLKELRNQRAYTIQNDLVHGLMWSWLIDTEYSYHFDFPAVLVHPPGNAVLFLRKAPEQVCTYHLAQKAQTTRMGILLRYEAILTDENKAKYKKFVEEYNMATNT